MLEISGLRRVFGDSGDLIPEMVASLTGGLTDESWSGTSFPSEKSSSAGSMATGSSSLNSKSPAGASRSGSSEEGGDFAAGCGGGCLGAASLEESSSRLKEMRGLSQP